MEQAHRLLGRKKDGLTVRAAAQAVGYREASGLRQQFKRFYGYNPSEIQPEPPEYPADVF
jgi:AraC-like DNA-binding protein